jgi:hypothetical protein
MLTKSRKLRHCSYCLSGKLNKIKDLFSLAFYGEVWYTVFAGKEKRQMSTRSAIIEKTATGYRGIYCHSDGYISHVGRILANFYTTPARVTELLNLGDLSSLGESMIGNTVAYGRDRGETDTEAYNAKTVAAIKRHIDHSYCYVFDGSSWTVNGKDLKEMLEATCIQ